MANIKVKLFYSAEEENKFLIFENEDIISFNTQSKNTSNSSQAIYNAFASDGTIKINDKNLELYKKANQGFFDNYNYNVFIYLNEKIIAKHIINRLPEYNFADKTLSLELGNELDILDETTYEGYLNLLQSESVEPMFKDIMQKTFGITDEDYNILINTRAYYEEKEITFLDIFNSKNLIIPYMPSKTSREAFNNILTLTHCSLILNKNGEFKLVYIDKKHSQIEKGNQYQILPNSISQPLVNDILVQNKYDNCVVSSTLIYDEAKQNILADKTLNGATLYYESTDLIDENIFNSSMDVIELGIEKPNDWEDKTENEKKEYIKRIKSQKIFEGAKFVGSVYQPIKGNDRRDIFSMAITHYKEYYLTDTQFTTGSILEYLSKFVNDYSLNPETPFIISLQAKRIVTKATGVCHLQETDEYYNAVEGIGFNLYEILNIQSNEDTEIILSDIIVGYTKDNDTTFTESKRKYDNSFGDYVDLNYTLNISGQGLLSGVCTINSDHTITVKNFNCFVGKEIQYVTANGIDLDFSTPNPTKYYFTNIPCDIYTIQVIPEKLVIQINGTAKEISLENVKIQKNSNSKILNVSSYGSLLQYMGNSNNETNNPNKEMNYLLDYYKNGLQSATISCLSGKPYYSKNGKIFTTEPFEIGDIVEIVDYNKENISYGVYVEQDWNIPYGHIWQVVDNDTQFEGGAVYQSLKLKQVQEDSALNVEEPIWSHYRKTVDLISGTFNNYNQFNLKNKNVEVSFIDQTNLTPYPKIKISGEIKCTDNVYGNILPILKFEDLELSGENVGVSDETLLKQLEFTYENVDFIIKLYGWYSYNVATLVPVIAQKYLQGIASYYDGEIIITYLDQLIYPEGYTGEGGGSEGEGGEGGEEGGGEGGDTPDPENPQPPEITVTFEEKIVPIFGLGELGFGDAGGITTDDGIKVELWGDINNGSVEVDDGTVQLDYGQYLLLTDTNITDTENQYIDYVKITVNGVYESNPFSEDFQIISSDGQTTTFIYYPINTEAQFTLGLNTEGTTVTITEIILGIATKTTA